MRRLVDLQEIASCYFKVTFGWILARTDVGKANGGHLVLAPQIVDILVHPRIQGVLVFVIATAGKERERG